MSAADELRAAATKLHGLSGMASRGRWRVEANRPTREGQSYAVRPDYPSGEPAWFKVADGCTVMDAQFIAVMNPIVTLALAEWLEDETDNCAKSVEVWADNGKNPEVEAEIVFIAALAVARAINAGTEQVTS